MVEAIYYAVVLIPMIQEVISLLFLSDLRYRSFLTNLVYCTSFSLLVLSDTACFSILSFIASTVISRYVALEQLPSDVILINLSALVALINELLNQEKQAMLTLQQFVAERVRQQADSVELTLTFESQFNQQLKQLSQLAKKPLQVSHGAPTKKEGRLSHPQLLLDHSMQSVNVVDVLVPLVEFLTKLPLIVVQNSHVYELLCVALSRQLFCECLGCETVEEEELKRRITRLTTLQRTMDHLITACHEDASRTQLLACVYWVVLHDCYCVINGQTDNGGVILHLLQSECLQLADQLSFMIPIHPQEVGFCSFVNMQTQEFLQSVGKLSNIDDSAIQTAHTFGEAALSVCPLRDYVLSQLHSQTFVHLSSRDSVVKNVSGKVYEEAIATARLECEKRVSALRLRRKTWMNDALTAPTNRLSDWLTARDMYGKDELGSKLFYLRRCTYFVMDPHMDEDGVRRKQMRLPPPARSYESAREWTEKNSLQNETPVLSSDKHEGPKNQQGYECLNVSVYDSQWGVVNVDAHSLTFRKTYRSCAPGEISVLPDMEPIFGMREVQEYSLQSIDSLYKRTYRCQQSALEFFYRSGGFRNSVFLYFSEEVGDGLFSHLERPKHSL